MESNPLVHDDNPHYRILREDPRVHPCDDYPQRLDVLAGSFLTRGPSDCDKARMYNPWLCNSHDVLFRAEKSVTRLGPLHEVPSPVRRVSGTNETHRFSMRPALIQFGTAGYDWF
jgi:hypothetical protein